MTGAAAAGGPVDGPPAVLPVDLGAGVRAGFTTRTGAGGQVGAGGATAPGDNVGLNVGDDRAAVLARRERVARWAGGPVAWATQVHGACTLVVPSGGPPPTGEPVGEGDALVSAGPAGVAVVVADCVPVLLADADAGVVAAVHAGRRGLADGVLESAVAAMVDRGARVARVRAAVGPAICGACYEVPAELRDEVAGVVPGVAARTTWGTPALDLPAGATAVLRGLGVDDVLATGLCTRTDERFHSHRRSVRTGEAPGRCAAVVRLDRAVPYPTAPDRTSPGVSRVSDPGGAPAPC